MVLSWRQDCEDLTMYRKIAFLIVAAGLVIGCERGADEQTETVDGREIRRVREAAVAGGFYSASKEALSDTVDGLLNGARSRGIKGLRGLVCPHAGYSFSGPVAAVAYKQLIGRDIRTAVVLAPTHYARFKGASIPDVDAYRTPLGLILLSESAADLAKQDPFVTNPHCEKVGRPRWWRQARIEVPPFGHDTPHTWEHSLEVQLPFLQKVLKDFRLIPAVMGDVDPEEVAHTLSGYLDNKTIVIASSDLSHDEPYDVARKLDAACVDAICRLDTDTMAQQSACGKPPILSLMHLAKLKGWKTRILDVRNSRDVAGGKSRVVGYTAIAFYDPKASDIGLPAEENTYGPAERKFLMELARKTLVQAAQGKDAPKPDAADVPKQLAEPKACFVTLKKSGMLRGCIGGFFPTQPLYQAVVDMTVSAATKDIRFDPVKPNELKAIEIEISVLTVPKELAFNSPEDLLAKLRMHVDGVILKMGPRQSTFLPQVWQQMPDKETFLARLSYKAGMAPNHWREPGTIVLTYQVEAFHEHEVLRHDDK